MNVETVRSKDGFTLGMAMVYVAIITAVIASVTSLVLAEYRATKNSAAYVQALYAAEAGIDLALYELNQEAQGATAWTGWIKSGTSYRLESTQDGLHEGSTFNPELSVVADTSSLRIMASGHATSSARSATVSRDVVVKLVRHGQTYAIQNWEESATKK
jgi:Tfp pilus assembly protein PilX